ncbi:MAG: hypothetical protein AB1481_06175 [Candidatus Omnitrophota bacterium]
MKIICVILSLAMLLSSFGCASYRPAGSPSEDISFYPNKKEQAGLSIAIKLLDAKETRGTFKRNIHKKQVAPAFIIIKNDSQNVYKLKKGLNEQGLFSANEVADKGKFQVFWRAALFSPFIISIILWPLLLPAIVGGLGTVNANKSMREDYVNKEISDEEIHPGESLAGFLYFDSGSISKGLRIELTDVVTKEPIVFEFPGNNLFREG